MNVSGDSNLLAVYSANASAVVLAFSGTNDTLVNVTTDNPLETDAFYKGAFSNQGNGSVDPVLADPFKGRIGGGYQGLYAVRVAFLLTKWALLEISQCRRQFVMRNDAGVCHSALTM